MNERELVMDTRSDEAGKWDGLDFVLWGLPFVAVYTFLIWGLVRVFL